MGNLSKKVLYDRRWKVTVKDPKTGVTKVWGHYKDHLFKADLHILFSTQEGESSKHSSECNLIITNLDEKNRKFCTQKGLEVLIEAGYPEFFGRVFKGVTSDLGYTSKEHVRSFGQGLNRKEEQDWSTQLNLVDTFPSKDKTVISIAFSPKTTYRTIFNKLQELIGITEGKINLPKDLAKTKVNNGASFYGIAQSQLDDLTSRLGLVYTIKDKALNVYDPAVGLNEEVFVINGDTGLIGSPEKTEKGYTFTVLLYPNLFKGQYIRLDSLEFKLDLVISKIRYRGDSSQNEFYCDIEAISKRNV